MRIVSTGKLGKRIGMRVIDSTEEEETVQLGRRKMALEMGSNLLKSQKRESGPCQGQSLRQRAEEEEPKAPGAILSLITHVFLKILFCKEAILDS